MTEQEKRKKMTLKKCSLYVLLFLILYIGSYSVLSYFGGYHLAKSGNRRLDMGWSFLDIKIWRPRIGHAQIYHKIDGNLTLHADWVGLFYCPLILLDQKYVHETKYLSEPTQIQKE